LEMSSKVHEYDSSIKKAQTNLPWSSEMDKSNPDDIKWLGSNWLEESIRDLWGDGIVRVVKVLVTWMDFSNINACVHLGCVHFTIYTGKVEFKKPVMVAHIYNPRYLRNCN
jgi:hypothetical protein